AVLTQGIYFSFMQDTTAPVGAAGHALAVGAAAHAQLQVLLLCEGPGHLLGSTDGEGQLAAGLAHGDGGADVVSADLHVPARAALPDHQAAPTWTSGARCRTRRRGRGRAGAALPPHTLSCSVGSCTGKRLGETGRLPGRGDGMGMGSLSSPHHLPPSSLL
uniref:Uncharacterized protein n=1 Tax=Cyanoderma ruficeps TaxID=181631 RepID=A0A8C3NQK3_9PASS